MELNILFVYQRKKVAASKKFASLLKTNMRGIVLSNSLSVLTGPYLVDIHITCVDNLLEIRCQYFFKTRLIEELVVCE